MPFLSCRYFSLFMNLLNECSEAAPEEKDVGRHRLQSSKLGELRTCTIQAMSNLLSANIDSGLMHSIGEPSLVWLLPSSKSYSNVSGVSNIER